MTDGALIHTVKVKRHEGNDENSTVQNWCTIPSGKIIELKDAGGNVCTTFEELCFVFTESGYGDNTILSWTFTANQTTSTVHAVKHIPDLRLSFEFFKIFNTVTLRTIPLTPGTSQIARVCGREDYTIIGQLGIGNPMLRFVADEGYIHFTYYNVASC